MHHSLMPRQACRAPEEPVVLQEAPDSEELEERLAMVAMEEMAG